MSITVLSTGEHSSWASYFDRLDGAGPYHDPQYLDAIAVPLEGPGAEAELFVFEETDGFVYYPYIRRPLANLSVAADVDRDLSPYSDVSSSWYYGGPLLGGSDPSPDLPERFAREFAEWCADNGVVSEFVRFDPNLENHETFAALDPEFDRETVTVDLTRSEEAIWDDFETRNRNAIRQARDTALAVEPTTDTAAHRAFYDIYTNAMEAKDAAEHYRFEYDFFADLLSRPELATLLVARYDDEVVGGSMLVHDGDIAHDYLRASNPDYWDRRVNNLLCYRAVMHMRETGRELFDFQGGRPGVFKFKKQFSRSGRGEFHISGRVHLPDLYEDLTAAADVDPTGGFFPAYRA